MAITFNARTLLTRAYQLVGVIAENEPMTDAQGEDGLAILNGMLDGFNTQRLTISATARVTFPYTSLVNTYTIGAGGDWDMARPVEIEACAVLSNTASPPFEIVQYLIDDQQYDAISIKDLRATFPTQLYYNATFPLGTIFVWPTPTDAANYSQVLYLPILLTEFANLTTSVTMPPGYYRMLYYNVATELGEAFAVQVRPTIYDFARRSLADIKRVNLQPLDLVTDPALPGAGGIYNIYPDQNY